MPTIQQLADVANFVRSTINRDKYQSLAALYPDYLYTQQFLQSTRRTTAVSTTVQETLEVAAPSSFEASYVNHPLTVAVPDLLKKVTVELVKYRAAVGFSTDEQAFSDNNPERVVKAVEVRMKKVERDWIEGLENALATKPATSSVFPQTLLGLPYWLPADAAATDLEMNGGSDPVGFTAGAGNLTVAEVPRWAHAVAGWTKLSDDDLFDKMSEFLNRAMYFSPVSYNAEAPNTPQRQILIQMPLRMAYERLLTVANDNLRSDVGMWRNNLNFRSIPMYVWHAISDPASPVRPAHGLLYIIDWNTFDWITHSSFDGSMEEPVHDPNVPGAIKIWRQAYTQLRCLNRERNATFYSGAAEFLPSAT